MSDEEEGEVWKESTVLTKFPLLLDLAGRTHKHTNTHTQRFSLHFHPIKAALLLLSCWGLSPKRNGSFPHGEPQENVTASCSLWLLNSRREGMTAQLPDLSLGGNKLPRNLKNSPHRADRKMAQIWHLNYMLMTSDQEEKLQRSEGKIPDRAGLCVLTDTCWQLFPLSFWFF